MSTHNVCFYGELSKIIFQLSPNTLLICSTGAQSIKGTSESLHIQGYLDFGNTGQG